MQRSRKIVLVAHCLLNVNSRVEGIARYPSVHPLICELADRDYGVIQLPCPELPFEGLDREPQDLEYYDTPEYREHCRKHATRVAEDVAEYLRNGYAIGPVVGVEGSPSCGVDEAGIFMQELRTALEPQGIAFTSVDRHEKADGIERLLDELEAR